MSFKDTNNKDFFIYNIHPNCITPPVPLSADGAWSSWEEAFRNETYCDVSIHSGIPTVLTTGFTEEMKDSK